MKKKSKQKPLKSSQLPATQEQLWHTRDELIGEIRYAINLSEQRATQLIRSEISSVNSKMDTMKSEMRDFKNEIQKSIENYMLWQKKEMSRHRAIIEEQNAKCTFALDGYSQVYEKQEKFEIELREEVTSEINSLKKICQTH